jgi:hypothetical protein
VPQIGKKKRNGPQQGRGWKCGFWPLGLDLMALSDSIHSNDEREDQIQALLGGYLSYIDVYIYSVFLPLDGQYWQNGLE